MSEPRFQPLPHQRKALDYLLNGGKRAVLVWHRRSGKDLTLWNYSWVAAQQRVGIYYYFYPTYAQAKKAIWFGMDENGTRFLDYIPSELIAATHDTDMRIHFGNGSILQLIGSDNIDSIMSTNPIGCVFSEYALQDPRGWRFVLPILHKNGGWAAFPYTPRGHNHGYTLYNEAKRHTDWFTELLTIEDTGLINPDDLEEDRMSGTPEEIIQQEYYCSFTTSNEGSYFGHQIAQADSQGRIRDCMWDPQHFVHTAWDFGINDSTCIWFIQTDGKTIWAIDQYDRGNNEGLPFFAKLLHEKGYVYGTHLAPHDVMKREYGTGDQIMQAGANLGIHFTLVPRTDKKSQLQAAHFLIPRTVFDRTNCERGIDGLIAYEREWDQLNKVFKNTPKHDWASHIADAYMTLACGVDLIDEGNKRSLQSSGQFDPRQYEAYSNYDPRSGRSNNGNNSNDISHGLNDSHSSYDEDDSSIGIWEVRESIGRGL